MSLWQRTPLGSLTRLHWRLALGYMAATVAGVVLLEIAVLAVLGWYFFNSPLLPNSLADEVAIQSISLERRLSAGLPLETAAVEWVDEYRNGAVWTIDAGWTEVDSSSDDGSWLRFGVFARRGSLGPDSLVDGTYRPEEFQWSGQALALAERAWDTTARQGISGYDADGSVLAAMPVHDARGKPVGIVLARSNAVTVVDFVFATGFDLVLPSALAVTAFAAVVGLAFGLLAARPLNRRLSALTRASDAWSRGDFSVAVNDDGGDEIGVLAERLDAMALQLRELMSARQVVAALEERDRIARDLHDTAKQQAFALSGQLAAARMLLDSDATLAGARIRTAEHMADELRSELQGLIVDLRPSDLRGHDLSQALRRFVATWSARTDIATDVTTDLVNPLTEDAEQALYRVLQEALANVARHSRARRVAVGLLSTQDGVQLEIADDGIGFSPEHLTARGIGLDTMRERLERLGGRLVVHSQPGRGTRIVAALVG